MKINTHVDLSGMTLKMNGIRQRDIPFALSLAINATAKHSKEKLVKEMPKVFDRPTPWVQRGIEYSSSSKNNLLARVSIRKQWLSTLRPEVYGGSRQNKRTERLFQQRGLMRPGWFMVPGELAKIDQYGGISRSTTNMLLSYFAAYEQGRGSQKNTPASKRYKTWGGTNKRRGTGYIAISDNGKKGSLHPGIYQTANFAWGIGIKGAVLIFVPYVKYKPRFHFFAVGPKAAKSYFPKAWYDASAKVFAANKAKGWA